MGAPLALQARISISDFALIDTRFYTNDADKKQIFCSVLVLNKSGVAFEAMICLHHFQAGVISYTTDTRNNINEGGIYEQELIHSSDPRELLIQLQQGMT